MIIRIDMAKKMTIAAGRVRAERDDLLKASDWRVLPGAPDSDGWISYRQALRDVPQQLGFPFDVIWPTKPE